MFTPSIRFANILMVIAALALCVSVCIEPGVSHRAKSSANDVASIAAPATQHIL